MPIDRSTKPPSSVRLARVRAGLPMTDPPPPPDVPTLNLEPVLRGELLAEMAAILLRNCAGRFRIASVSHSTRRAPRGR
jgi:hypothetical protein